MGYTKDELDHMLMFEAWTVFQFNLNVLKKEKSDLDLKAYVERVLEYLYKQPIGLTPIIERYMMCCLSGRVPMELVSDFGFVDPKWMAKHKASELANVTIRHYALKKERDYVRHNGVVTFTIAGFVACAAKQSGKDPADSIYRHICTIVVLYHEHYLTMRSGLWDKMDSILYKSGHGKAYEARFIDRLVTKVFVN